METVPQEIFQAIFNEVEEYPKKFKPYLTVSRRWQRTVEQFYFSRLRIKNTDLSTFATLFHPPNTHRKALIRSLTLEVQLPAYEGDNYHQHEELNNQVFSAAILELFQVLETFNNDEDVKRNARRGNRLELHISSISSPNDNFYSLDYTPKILGVYIQLLNYEKLPTLSCVSACFSGHGCSRRLDPASGILIISKMKDLKVSKLDYYDSRECINDETRKIIRPAFANALSTCTHTLGEFDLRMRYSSPIDEASSPPNYVPVSSRADPMNLALHEFIQRANISTFHASSGSHVISPDFFWPYDNTKAAPIPFWPNLKDLCVTASPATPDGSWYFMGDPNVASHSKFTGATAGKDLQISLDTEENRNRFRNVPIPERMDPLLMAMARAICHAPSIERLDLSFDNIELAPKYVKAEGLKRQFEICYSATGSKGYFHDDDPMIENPLLMCDVQDWRPNKEVESWWMKALGPDGVIMYR
ncbi:hypothetical protein FQN49_000024 [Arthroderma sp. PD_2]|nr:hypothetical protein FQN49_000024 [Arthroderma sp. PD_2]